MPTCGSGSSLTLTNPLAVAGLANNGGPTKTIALAVGSAALEAGDDTVCNAAALNQLDQRGIARPFGPHCDIGAVEMGGYYLVRNGSDNGQGVSQVGSLLPPALILCYTAPKLLAPSQEGED